MTRAWMIARDQVPIGNKGVRELSGLRCLRSLITVHLGTGKLDESANSKQSGDVTIDKLYGVGYNHIASSFFVFNYSIGILAMRSIYLVRPLFSNMLLYPCILRWTSSPAYDTCSGVKSHLCLNCIYFVILVAHWSLNFLLGSACIYALFPWLPCMELCY